jgi:hypothetical protein
LDFELAIAAVIQSILLSPDTLYMLERGEPTGDPEVLVLSNHEIASRLSFLFLDAPPDAELSSKADAGELQDPDVLRLEAERLLGDPRAQGAVGRFMQEWFGVADQVFVDHAEESLALAWNEEVSRLVGHIVFEGGSLAQLLDGSESFVNQPLAEHYGIEPNPSSGVDDWQLVTLPAERRGGLLTTAQFAASTSHNNSTSIIHRGKAIRKRLLCADLGTPDPAFLEMELELPDDPTVRDRMDSRLSQPVCGGCHTLMDPIGIGMEDLDENGNFRSTYDDGRAVDTAGQLLGTSLAAEFSGSVELAHRLAESEDFAQCAATQWMRYSTGRSDVGEHGECLVHALADDAARNGDSIAELLLAVVQSDAFIYRLMEEDQ